MLSAFTPTIRPNEKVLPLQGSPLNGGPVRVCFMEFDWKCKFIFNPC